jgi:hypothetical protein
MHIYPNAQNFWSPTIGNSSVGAKQQMLLFKSRLMQEQLFQCKSIQVIGTVH